MGRLFWKFFFAFWLALLFAGITAGVTVWLRHQSDLSSSEPGIDAHATAFIMAAKDIHDKGGDKALRNFLQNMQFAPAPDIYAVDDAGHELLGRKIDSKYIQAAREHFSQQQGVGPVAQITSEQGLHYLLFAPMPEKRFGRPWPKNPVSTAENSEINHFSALPQHLAPHPPGPPPRRLSLIALLTFGGFASVLFSILLAWYFTRPIRSLREAFTQVADGKLDTRVGKKMGKGRDELTELGKQFDEMTAQIQNLVTSQQRLLHDVSHELRSPLARMQAAIGIAQQQPEKVADILDRLEKDSQRISDLVGELLLLSKLESGVSEQHLDEINLDDLINDIAEDAQFEAASKRIHIRFNSDAPIHILGQAPLLQRAIENVVRNAVKYTEPGTTINVSTELNERSIQIDVKDQGPGVDETELTTIFKPFYRSGNKRVLDSIGLGLTIASRAVETHGGSISAQNNSSGGLCVTISLPLDLLIKD